jgi:polyisoprenyl-phosphate glycosyltransferase
LVDDHSTDGGPAFVRRWMVEDSRVAYMRLSRNQGAHTAIAAGLTQCRGDYAIVLAADLQDPPEAGPRLLEKLENGYDVVWGCRSERPGDTWITRFLAKIYYQVTRRLALPAMPEKGVDLVSMSRKVIDAYNAIPEKHSSLVPMILWMGFRQGEVEFVRTSRASGKSKWTLSRKVKLFIDTIVSFSYVPIRLMSFLGLVMAVAGILYASAVIISRLFGWGIVGTGFAALMTVLLVGQGMILLMLGILGEYLWRTFDEARGRPRYIVEEYRPSKRETKISVSKGEPL